MELDFSGFDPSLALDAVLDWDERHITTRSAPGLPPYLALEAVAQTCGLHLRRRHGFRIQACLVSLTDLSHSPGLGDAALTIRATLLAETRAGASYAVDVADGPSCRVLMGLTATENPDNLFRERFERLCTPSLNA